MSKSAPASKKTISQHDLRRFMNEQKKKTPQNVKKIESPLARYSDSGELRCVLCDSRVRGEALWPAHLASKEHLSNIAAAKKLKAKAEEPAAFKRPAPAPLPPPPTKKPKSILKNAPPAPPTSGIPSDFFDSGAKVKEERAGVKTESKTNLLAGQYDDSDEEEEAKPVGIQPLRLPASKHEPSMEKEPPMAPPPSASKAVVPDDASLPEGFFDDPKMDAKARNVEYRDPVEEEWEKFQRAIREEAEQSQAIIQEEQEEATADRQLEEIDEQMRNWSKVLELEQRKEAVRAAEAAAAAREAAAAVAIKEEDDSDDEEGFDEFLDWRSKQS